MRPRIVELGKLILVVGVFVGSYIWIWIFLYKITH